jgi:hypothetical protein
MKNTLVLYSQNEIPLFSKQRYSVQHFIDQGQVRWDTLRNSTYQYNKNENGALRPAVTVIIIKKKPLILVANTAVIHHVKDVLHNNVLFLD